MAIIIFPAFAHHPAEDNENMPDNKWEEINDNLEDVDSPHLDLVFLDMGSDISSPVGEGSTGMNINLDADLERIQGGDQTGEGEGNVPGGEGVEDPEPDESGELNQDGWYLHQEIDFRPGEVAIDEDFDWGQTETKFRGEMLTSSTVADDGILNLYQGNVVTIASELVVDQDDVGQLAQCLVVAQYKISSGADAVPANYMLSENGWESWSGDLNDLSGVACQLGETQRIIAHDAELFPGEFHLYFGYQLEDARIVYSPEPFSFSIQ